MGVTGQDLDAIEAAFRVRLPAAYRDHLVTHGPGQVPAADDFYVELWSLEDVRAITIELERLFPGLVFFGGDGSREHLAFDFRRDPPPVVMTDITSLPDEPVVQAATFGDFLEAVRTRGLDFGVDG